MRNYFYDFSLNFSRYVKSMQILLSESFTQLQRGEDGQYGRRTGNKHIIHDIYVMPHLFGSLAKHEEGFELLKNHPGLDAIIKVRLQNYLFLLSICGFGISYLLKVA